jgi:hypothetical protein
VGSSPGDMKERKFTAPARGDEELSVYGSLA